MRTRAYLVSLLIFVFFFLGMYSCNPDKSNKELTTNINPEIEELEKILIKDSTNHQALYHRAEWYYSNQDFDSSIDDLKKAIEYKSDQPQYHHLLSDAYMDYFRSKEALLVMESAAGLFPERIPTLLKLSETQHILKQYESSLFTIAKILTLNSQEAEAYFMMGLNFRSIDELDKAINAFQTATELNPELLDAWLILGKLFEDKQNPMALKYYEAAININPENPSTWHSKAFYLQNNGQLSEAINIYKQINNIDKYYLDAYLNAGILYMELDSFEQARDQFNIMAQLERQNFIAYYYRGLAFEALGQLDKAKEDYQNSINLNSKFSKARGALNKLNTQ